MAVTESIFFHYYPDPGLRPDLQIRCDACRRILRGAVARVGEEFLHRGCLGAVE